MAKETTIRGVTVKIGADTSDFIKGLKKIDKEIQYSEKYAQELQKQLELKWDNAKWSKAQKIVQDDLRDTEAKAKAIREQIEFLNKSGADVNSESFKKLNVELEKTTTQTLKLQQSLEQINKLKLDRPINEIKKLSDNLGNAAKKTAILSATAVGAIAGITKLGKDAVAVGDDIQTTADQYNLSAEAIQKWNYIALQSDVASEQLYKSMTKVRDAVGTALTGQTNTATKAIETLVGDISKLPNDTEGAFESIIIALSSVEDKTLQAYYANEIFGERIATDLIPLLNQGANGLKQLGIEFEQVGYLSNGQVRNLADFDNQLNMVNQKLFNAKTELGLALLPIVEKFSEILTDVVVPAIKNLADWFNNLSEPMQNIITGGLMLIAVLSPMFLIMSKIVGVIPNMIKMFNALKNASWKTYAGIAAIGAALGLVFDLIGNWGELTTLGKVLRSLALTALVAAAAMTVFHASWSLGLAVGAITAAVVAGIAAINSAGKSIGIDTNFKDSDSISNYANSSYKVPTNADYGSKTYNEDNSTYNININADLTGDLNYDAKALADQVIKQIQVAKQSSGR